MTRPHLSATTLGAIVEAAGGVTHVARTIGVAHTPLSRHVRQGEATLSPLSLGRLRDVLGIDETGALRPGVHLWRGRASPEHLRIAVQAAFPGGGELAVAPWSHAPRSVGDVAARLRMRREVTVVRGARRTRDRWLVLVTPAGRVYAPEWLGPMFRWRDGTAAPAVLHNPHVVQEWIEGDVPALDVVTACWTGNAATTWADAVAALEQAGLEPNDVIQHAREWGASMAAVRRPR